MIIKCPHCGEICESDSEIAVGQHIECPFCAKKFTYGMDTGSLGSSPNEDRYLGAVAESNTETRFCGHCGTKISATVSFCPACGKDLRTKEVERFEAKVADFSNGVNHTIKEQWLNSGPLQKMLSLLWLSVIISALSVLIGCFDVREYYSLGRGGYFIIRSSSLAIQSWLIKELTNRKSWARKAFIVLTVLSVVVQVLGGITMSFVSFLNIASLIIEGYCLCLCFSKEVTSAFKPYSLLQGAQALSNRHHCIAFVVALLVGVIFGEILEDERYGSESWCEDCTEALLKGSSSAREDMISFFAEVSVAEGYDNPTDPATEFVDDFIKDEKSQKNTSRDIDYGKMFRNVKPGVVKAAGWSLAKILKGLGIVVAGIFTLVGGALSKDKKSQQA